MFCKTARNAAARVALSAVGPIAIALAAQTAQAGPLEETEQVAFHPTDPDRLVLRYEFGGEGLVYSDDGAADWSVLCSTAMQPPTMERPPPTLESALMDQDGTVFVGTYFGLLRDDGSGCGWQEVPELAGTWVADMAHHPSDPSVLFAVTSTAPDGMNGLWRRQGSGEWEPLGARDAIDIGSLAVVATDGGNLRFYVGAIRGVRGEAPNQTPNYVLRVSDDMGDSWEEFEYGDVDGKLHLEAADPSAPDRILVSIKREAEGVDKPLDSVMLSSDRGESFSEYLQVHQFGGLDLASDGRIWIGDRGSSFMPNEPAGLFFASSLDAQPAVLDETLHVRCVEHRPDDRIFICQPFEAGFTEADGSGYTRAFSYRAVEHYVACSDQDLVQVCRQQMLSAWCGASHFPEAPFCCPYPDRESSDPNITPGSDAPEFVLDCPDPMAMPDAGGSPADGGVMPDGEITDGSGTAEPPSSGGGGGGGCAVARAGSPAASGGPGGTQTIGLALLALALLGRRRLSISARSDRAEADSE